MQFIIYMSWSKTLADEFFLYLVFHYHFSSFSVHYFGQPYCSQLYVCVTHQNIDLHISLLLVFLIFFFPWMAKEMVYAFNEESLY